MKVITAEKTTLSHIAVTAEKNPTANFIAATTRETTTSCMEVVTAEKTTLSHIAICLQQ